MIQTTWPDIRVALYKHPNGLFQFMEEGLDPGDRGKINWSTSESGWYEDFEAAKVAMIQFYCDLVEDEYVVDADSVTVLLPPDFKGPHHPVLRIGVGPHKGKIRED